MTMTCKTTFNIEHQLISLRQHFETIVCDHLPSPNNDVTTLYSAMNYAVKNGGKRLRPILVYLTGELLNVPHTDLDACAVSVELIHAYSLIHDDLPAMDNSDLRRGKPTCHLAFDEATAILAGDCLQTLAFEILINQQNANLDAEKRLQMLAILADVSGYQGMGGGQAQDLHFTGQQMNTTELLEMYRLKTGALIQACVTLPLQLVTLTPQKQNALRQFGHWLGLAFQIQDDILDHEADSATLGKPQNLDERNDKHTIVNAVGIPDAKTMVREFAANALTALSNEFEATTLTALTHYLCHRNK